MNQKANRATVKVNNPAKSTVKECVVLVIDLENSTPFMKESGVDKQISKYFEAFTASFNAFLHGSSVAWDKDYQPMVNLAKPIHVKFLGDGYLVIWEKMAITDLEIIQLVKSLNYFQDHFSEFNNYIRQKILSTGKLPSRLRFSLTQGHLRTLKVNNRLEWLGTPINLASRLQNFSNAVQFILYGIGKSDSRLFEQNGFSKCEIFDIRGYEGSKLYVWVDSEDLANLQENKSKLFKRV